MKYPIETIKQWLAECNANKPLEPDDPRYVNLEAFQVEGQTHNLRNTKGVRAVAHCIRLAVEPTCQLFSGYTGTGKTTELKRLKMHMEEQGYTVLWADASNYHDLAHPLEIEDLIILIAAALGEACSELLGKGLMKDNYWDRLMSFMKNELSFDSATIKGPLSVKASIRNGNAPVWLELRRFLGSSLDHLKEDAHSFIEKCLNLVREQHQGQIVFILDSLEKLNGSEEQFRQIMESVKTVFRQHRDFLRLPGCHTVYTVPPYLGLAGADLSLFYDRKPQILPAIKVSDRYSQELVPYEEGVKALTELLRRRIPLEKVFGDRQDLLEKIIMYSGGHVRTLISFIRELLMENAMEDFPPTQNLVNNIIRGFGEEAVKPIRPEGVPLLNLIHKTNSLEDIPADKLHLLAQYVDYHLVLCYRNGEGWYEIHPLIRDNILRRSQAADQGSHD